MNRNIFGLGLIMLAMNKPNDSVRVVLFDVSSPDKFLILTEADDPKNWKLPGGKFDSVDEKPDDAARRELHEELNFAVETAEIIKVGELMNDDGKSARYIYRATVTPDSLSPSEEIALVQWVTTENIPDCHNKPHILSAVDQANGVR